MSNLENVASEFLALLGYIKRQYFKPAEQIARSRLSPAQFQAIAILYHQKPMTMSELAIEMKISKQQLTPIIAKLMETGLVTKQEDENDRRVVRIEITEQGRSIHQTLFKQIKINFTEKLSDIPEEELDELRQLLARMREIINTEK